MFETETVELTIPRGGTFDQTFVVSLDLTGWTVAMLFGSHYTLTAGSGLTITPSPGVAPTTLIEPILTPTQTYLLQGEVHWLLRFTDPMGRVGFPVAGPAEFVDP